MAAFLRRFFIVSRFEYILLIQTFATVLYYAFLITLFSRRFILKRVGNVGVESPHEISANDTVLAKQVAQAIRRSERIIPWRITCFAKAIAAKKILKLRGLSSTLYLGVAKVGSDTITAHAWLRCGNVVVTGKGEMARFTPVTFFS